MVLLHFLFLSSVTPTLNVLFGPGLESPAELLCGPTGICLILFSYSFSSLLLPILDSEFLADAMKAEAF
jgi:hypothetical protein